MNTFEASNKLLEPKKYDPLNPNEQKTAIEEAMSRYDSVAWKTPFNSPNAFQGLWQDHAAHGGSPKCPQSPMALLEKSAPKYKQVWVQSPREVHPALRQAGQSGTMHNNSYHDCRDYSPTRRGHVGFQNCSPETFQLSSRSPTKAGHGLSKSYSDSTFYTSGYPSSGTSGSLLPQPLFLSSSPKKPEFPVIREQEDMTTNRKVSIKECEDGFQMVNTSPRKQLFGEKGLLGRSYSARSPTAISPKKAGMGNWSGKIKQRLGDMGREFSGKVAAFEAAQRRPPDPGNSSFAISLAPYVQADIYTQLELMLATEVNEFLLGEAHQNRLSVSSVKAIAEQWRNKGRPQVLGFSYDLKTQRELVSLNVDTLHFARSTSFSRVKALSVLAAWKVLAQEVSVRTFCQPDSAIKKHFYDAETVLEYVNARPDTMISFQDLKSRVVSEIYLREKAERTCKASRGEEMAWSVPRGLRA